jgi:tetratricopeptide (TPR) repeat protein
MTHIPRETHDAAISARIDTSISALNEDILPSKIVPSQRVGKDAPLTEEENDAGNSSQAHSSSKPSGAALNKNNKKGSSIAVLLSSNTSSNIPPGMQPPVLTMITPNARETHATGSSRIDEAMTALDEDIPLPSKMVPSQAAARLGSRDVPLIEEQGENHDTGIPALNTVLSELKSFQKRDLEHGEESVELAETWNALGLVRLHMQRDAEEGRKCHEEALRIYRGKCDEDRVAVAVTLNDLGNCYEQLHQSSRALDSYNKALRLLKEQKMADNHVRMQATLRSISRLSRK